MSKQWLGLKAGAVGLEAAAMKGPEAAKEEKKPEASLKFLMKTIKWNLITHNRRG